MSEIMEGINYSISSKLFCPVILVPWTSLFFILVFCLRNSLPWVPPSLSQPTLAYSSKWPFSDLFLQLFSKSWAFTNLMCPTLENRVESCFTSIYLWLWIFALRRLFSASCFFVSSSICLLNSFVSLSFYFSLASSSSSKESSSSEGSQFLDGFPFKEDFEIFREDGLSEHLLLRLSCSMLILLSEGKGCFSWAVNFLIFLLLFNSLLFFTLLLASAESLISPEFLGFCWTSTLWSNWVFLDTRFLIMELSFKE